MPASHRPKSFAQELVRRAEKSLETAKTYDEIGYFGHAAGARRQAQTLMNAAGKVLDGQPVMEYETKQYDG